MYRKFLLEGALVVFSSDPTLTTPSAIRTLKVDEQLKDLLAHCNIYVVVTRRRIGVFPGELRFDQQSQILTGLLQVHDGDKKLKFHFRLEFQSTVPIQDIRVNKFPHNLLTIRFSNGMERKRSLFQLLPNMSVKLCEYEDFKVEYVGKAWGKRGERNSLVRLSKHETLQQVLADINNEKPLEEVFLLLYRFEYQKRCLDSSGILRPTASTEKEHKHWKEITDGEVDRKDRILLAEAGLINYFKPQYNKVYKHQFPDKNQKILKRIKELDFAGLIVEISTNNLKGKLYSDEVKHVPMPNFEPFHHIAQFRLHSKDERESFICSCFN